MSTILYGNFSLEIIDDLGTRVSRPGRLPNPAQLLSPRHPEAPTAPLMRGRTRESADALSAINAGRPHEFHASCGFGKTTLLRRVAVLAAGHGIAPHCLYLRMDSDRVEDLLRQLVTRLFSSTRPVKLTPDGCAQVLGTVSAVIAVDDVSADPERLGYLLNVLRDGRVVIGASRPVLGSRGDSMALAGLPAETALLLLAILALVAGAMITPQVAATLDGVADLGEGLETLHHAGLAERGDDHRFGLPACNTESYRELLLTDLSLAASAQSLCEFLVGAMRNPSAIDSHSAADAALALIELAAEKQDWATVAQLVKAADAVLFVTGRSSPTSSAPWPCAATI